MRTKVFLKHIGLLCIISVFFVGVLQVVSLYLDKDSYIASDENTNASRFQSAYSSQFGVIGVAISTRIGIDYVLQNSPLNSRFYQGIETIPATRQEQKIAREKLLKENTLIVQEYYNVSKTNIIDALKTSNDRRRTIENFINQIELRTNNAQNSITSLEKQKTLYREKLSLLEQEINNEKIAMEAMFKEGSIQNTLTRSDNYFTLRNAYVEYFTDIVFINQFLMQYQFLNDYNADILHVIKLNKEAIIQEHSIVIPEIGQQYLRPLDLIQNESDM